MLDMDTFKTDNDTYGHPQGDALLRTVADMFTAAIKRSTDLTARLGGKSSVSSRRIRSCRPRR